MQKQAIQIKGMTSKDNRAIVKGMSSTDNVTIVTAFINIGTVPGAGKVSRQVYTKRAQEFRRVNNPVYAFFTDEIDLRIFRNIRLSQPKTKLIKINQNDTWAFSLHQIIKNLLKKRRRNDLQATAQANYSCVMNAKYEFMAKAIKENAFDTNYFSWMDYGYLRYLVGTSNSSMKLDLPPRFNKSRVAYSAFPKKNLLLKSPLSAQTIVSQGRYWVTGGFFIGTTGVLQQLIDQYNRTLSALIKLGWVGTDENTLFYMLQPNNNVTRTVDIQAYYGQGIWFHMGLLCLRQANKTQQVHIRFKTQQVHIRFKTQQVHIGFKTPTRVSTKVLP